MKLAGLATLAVIASTASIAKPVIQASEGVRASITRTETQTWTLSDAEKKNTATMMMSSISATAVAPSAKIKRKEWTAVGSQHRACFYNTYGVPVSGKYSLVLDILGQQVNVFDSVPVAGGQGFCVTRYLEMWVKPGDVAQIQTKATTHVEMDGQATDNEGHGVLDVR